MMARAHPKPGLRPFLPADAPILAEIFRNSIEELTADDYSPAQQEAWMATADDAEAFAKRLGDSLTLVGTLEGAPVGFIALAGGDKIDMLYVHGAAAGHGVGAVLLDAIEKLAAARGATKLTTDASDTARAFFEKHGYVPQRRNTVTLADEWLGNTTMDKPLPGKSTP
jgi:putative acetyltransferase